jgi:hypothetical protein
LILLIRVQRGQRQPRKALSNRFVMKDEVYFLIPILSDMHDSKNQRIKL